ncbi:MAG: hypothetical protein ABSE51_23615 [Terracidiphilus sp.]|jgi:hypothetical protein
MITLLNIALLAVGSAATLAAFGGETWKKGESPIYRRITVRGWVSLLCLALALFLGVAREILAAKENAAAKAEADKERVYLTNELNAAKQREETLDLRVADLSEINKLIRNQLSDAQTTLGTVKTNLSTTTEALHDESLAGLVSSLTTSGQFVRDMFLYIPITNKVTSGDDFRHFLLPHFNSLECNDLVGSEVDLRITENQSESLIYDSEDGKRTHTYYKDNLPKIDIVADLPSGPNQPIFAGMKMHGRYMYFAGFHPKRLLAPQVYSTLVASGTDVIEIKGYWPKTFKTKEEYKSAAKKYPKVFKNVDESRLPDTDVHLSGDNTLPMPSECTEQMNNYFNAAFEGAQLTLLLKGQDKEKTIPDQNLTVSFRLKAQRVVKTMEKNHVRSVAVLFRVVAPPTFDSMDGVDVQKHDKDWPQESP